MSKHLCCLSIVITAIWTFTSNSPTAFAAGDLLLQRPAPRSTTDSADKLQAMNFPPAARQLAKQLNVLDIVESLSVKQHEYDQKSDWQLLAEITMMRQKLLMSMQYAGFEVEEALASIDGDLTFTNMQLSYVSAKRERSLMMNNISTFVGSGTLGLLDSSTSIKLGTPTPQIFGILGNCVAIGMPLLGLRHAKYARPRDEQTQTNVLAPILDRPYPGVAYDPVVWNYINSIPADSKTKMTRLQQLRHNWAVYRGIDTTGDSSKAYIDSLVGIAKKDEKLNPDLLKTRADLLFDVRGLVQNMYKDISELNNFLIRI